MAKIENVILTLEPGEVFTLSDMEKYTREARERGVKGQAVLNHVVTPEGRITLTTGAAPVPPAPRAEPQFVEAKPTRAPRRRRPKSTEK